MSDNSRYGNLEGLNLFLEKPMRPEKTPPVKYRYGLTGERGHAVLVEYEGKDSDKKVRFLPDTAILTFLMMELERHGANVVEVLHRYIEEADANGDF